MGNMYENQHSVVWIAGEMDFETGRFHMSHIQEMDAGFDFYAAQSMAMPDGRQVMMAWKEMWDRDFPSREDNWAGTYTFPRELTWKNGWLYQWPVRELEAYRKNKAATGGIVLHQGAISIEGISGDVIELDVELQLQGAKKAGLKVFAGQEHETLIYYDCDKKAVIFDRTHAGIHLSGVEENTDIRTCDIEEEDTLRLHVLLDRYSVEVFINGGRYTMTGNVYPDPEDTDVEIFCEGGSCAVLSAVKYDICVE
jgi:beta-fructofuranosidase